MADGVLKKGVDSGALTNGPAKHTQRIMAASARAESVGIFHEVLFVDRLQDLAQAGLYQLVLQHGNPKGPLLVASRLGDVHPPHRLWNIGHPMESPDQGVEVLHQVFCILFLGDPINAAGPGVLQLPEAFPQQFPVHQVKQAGEPALRVAAGLLRYALQFRGYTFFISGHDVYVPTTPLLLQWPFLFRHYPASPVLRHCPTPCSASVVLALLSLVPPYSPSL